MINKIVPSIFASCGLVEKVRNLSALSAEPHLWFDFAFTREQPLHIATVKGHVMADNTTENEVVIRSGRRVAVGSEWWDIRKDDEPCHFVDFITEARQFNGTVYLGFGSGVLEPSNTPILDIVSRMRMNLATAQVIHSLLGQMINDALKPADVSKAN